MSARRHADAASARLQIATVRFDTPETVDVAPADLYAFPEALPGLPEGRRYALIRDGAYAPLCWLQSLDEGPVCLPLLPLAALSVALGENTASDVLVVTHFDAAAGAFAVNLLAPLMLDRATATGRQVVLDEGAGGQGQRYPLRQHVAWDAAAGIFVPPSATATPTASPSPSVLASPC